MLTFIKVAEPKQIKDELKKFDPMTTTWIVADLKSKLEIQSECIKKDGFYLEDSILRISDFWQICLRRLGPEYKLVSEVFIEVLLDDFFKTELAQELISSMNLKIHQISTLLNYLTELAPMILSPDSESILKEWNDKKFQTNDVTWYKWYLLSRVCLKYLIFEKKVILNKWVASWLQSQKIELVNWPKNLSFDLGSEMTSIEMGLIQQLSKNKKVTVFVPDPNWKRKFKFLLNTYDQNEGFSEPIESSDLIEPNLITNKTNVTLRFATEALEVKYISLQVKKWISSGINPRNILVASPRCESYLEMLRLHFDFEQIPMNNKHVTSFSALGFFQIVLSKIQSKTDQVSWESLEEDYFNQENPQIAFEKFKSQFVQLMDANDLLASEDIKSLYFQKINLTEKMNRTSFIELFLKEIILVHNSIIRSGQILALEKMTSKIIKDFLSTTNDQVFEFKSWLKILTDILRNNELVIESAQEDGVIVSSIQSTVLLNISHVIWFGLDESGFKQNKINLLPIQDIEELKFNFDFPLTYPEESHIEFNLRWLSQSQFSQQIFMCSHTSSQADPLMISSFFLEQEKSLLTEEFNSKSVVLEDSQLDSLQKRFLDIDKNNFLTSVFRKMDQKEVKIQKFEVDKFSMTDIVSFDQCAFKLLASKGFGLREYPSQGLDIDPRQNGTIYHSLYEYLIKAENYKNYNSDELILFLENLRVKLKIYPNKDHFWKALRKKLLLSAQKFSKLEYERLNGKNVTHILEAQFDIKLDQIQISGRIDRIDVVNNKALVFDYKRSNTSDLSNGIEWIKKKELQMLFYLLACLESLNMEPEGALYFFYKNMEIKKGAINQEYIQPFSVESSSSKAHLDEKEFINLITEFKKYLYNLETKFLSFNFTPQPFKVEICDNCDWKDLCRATHL